MKALFLSLFCVLSFSVTQAHAQAAQGESYPDTFPSQAAYNDHVRGIADRAEKDQIADMKARIDSHYGAMKKILDEMGTSADPKGVLRDASALVTEAGRVRQKALLNGEYGLMKQANEKLQELHHELVQEAQRASDLHAVKEVH